jgi:Na+/melibiose symporter-like transporter
VAPESGSAALLPFLIIFAGLAAMVGSIMNISVMSALADIADENEVKYGYRQEGVLYSTRALFSKLDSAIGHFFASVALAVIAFPKKAAPGHVDQDVLNHLGLVDGPVAMIPGLIAAFFYARYRINKSSYEATKARLAELRIARATAP